MLFDPELRKWDEAEAAEFDPPFCVRVCEGVYAAWALDILTVDDVAPVDVYLTRVGDGEHFLEFREFLARFPTGPLGELLPLYGVCDDPNQLMSHPVFSWAQSSDLKIVFGVYPIRKSDQPPQCGWRWEKWGEYIGVRERRADYLYDEPEIDVVWVFQAYCKVE